MVKSIGSREVMKMLRDDGWDVIAIEGDHHQMKHPSKKGRVTVPHPVKDLPIGTIKSIERQSGIKLR